MTMSQPDVYLLILSAITFLFVLVAHYLLYLMKKRADAAIVKKSDQVTQGDLKRSVVTETENLERSFRLLEGEWTTMYSKFDKTLKSLQGRERRARKDEGEEEKVADGGDARLDLWRKLHP